MRRSVIEAPTWHEPATREVIELELQLITPMFGGGYATRHVDPLIPIRPAAIRGHLRFWWRATAGAQYSDPKDLYAAETAIWGGAAVKNEATVGKVAIQTEIVHAGDKAPYNTIAPKALPRTGPLHGYFLFPFQEQQGGKSAAGRSQEQQQGIPAAEGKQKVAFRLRLLLDDSLAEDQKREVRNALKAWIAFGGVGARTRRGCGALKVIGNNANEWLPPSEPEQLKVWLRQLLPSQTTNQRAALPSLSGGQLCLIVRNFNGAIDAWQELGRFWARFRKGHFGQAYNPMSGGKWRDYRQVLCRLRNQGNTLRLAKPYLGLPIIYQEIKSARNLCFTGNVEPAQSGRFASPVILKPVALRNNQIGALIVVLQADKPTTVKINDREYRLQPPTSDQEPLLKQLRSRDVLEAVIEAAKTHFGKGIPCLPIGGGS